MILFILYREQLLPTSTDSTEHQINSTQVPSMISQNHAPAISTISVVNSTASLQVT